MVGVVCVLWKAVDVKVGSVDRAEIRSSALSATPIPCKPSALI